MIRCKCTFVSFGLVSALVVALLCNAYLVFLLLWSGSGTSVIGSGYHDLSLIPSDSIINTITESENEIKPKVLTLNVMDQLKLMMNSTKRLRRKRTHNLIRLMNKLKLEIHAKNNASKSIGDMKNWMESPAYIIPPFAPELGNVMHFLSSTPIIKASVPNVGTQLKVMLTLEGGYKALLKPQWYNRSTWIEGVVYSGGDRHNGEIASFYLSLLLGLRRTPVAVGRRIRLTSEILEKADVDLAATFHVNNESRNCFYGVCRYCRIESSVCAHEGDSIEAAIILWLPDSVKLKSYRSPWQRTYKKNVKANWETDDRFCGSLQNQSRTYRLPNRRLLDLIDAAVFDFLISNGDRHHYEVVDANPRADAAVLLLDNGKSFGRPDVDYLDILAPLYQCCMIRKSLFTRLEMVESGPLGDLLTEISAGDLLSPLLTEDHITAINRRLGIVMQTIEWCAKMKSWDEVLILD